MQGNRNAALLDSSGSQGALMSAIVRSQGTTESERYLAKLADRTFLNLWSFPNVFIDKRSGPKGDGKELCDLLVVCGDHVLIFSDKTIEWPEGDGDDIELAWRRWYRRAIEKSVKQIRGAQRWLNEFPSRIFLDSACVQPLPLPLPPAEHRKVHGIVVARGAGEASMRYFGEGTGSLLVVPRIRGDAHTRTEGIEPFAIGDIEPDGPFVHVLDDATLDVVMGELDTITDFTEYLQKKERLIRSGHLISAGGEEDLVAYYMTHIDDSGEHGFPKPDGSDFAAGEAFVLAPGQYESLQKNGQYIAKKDADRDSYIWDQLIKTFTNDMVNGTAVVIEEPPFQLQRYEEGVRRMALIPRYQRRMYGTAILDALEKSRSRKRLTRVILQPPNAPDPETAFFLMTLAVPECPLPGGYEQYRRTRRYMLEGYALFFLREHPQLKRVVGIACEPPPELGVNRGGSEDMIFAEVPEWTPELLDALEERRRKFDIAKEGNRRQYRMSGDEFPSIPTDERSPRGSRVARAVQRALEEAKRRDNE